MRMFTTSLTVLVTMATITTVLAISEPPISRYLTPNQQYGSPKRTENTYSSVSSSLNQVNQYLPPNGEYGVPGTGNGVPDDGTSNVPAKYEFEYIVNDSESGNDFGHKESRDGDLTRGVYYVLLPDGRRQTVEYEADQNGYRPKVTYSQRGFGIASDNSNGGGFPEGNGGYSY